jgi:8-oxo-dGTP diphosphatase
MTVNLRPKVGVGVLIFNDRNQILLGQRLSIHGNGDYGPPGGHLEFLESFEECAIREVQEEVGIIISNPQFLTATNDIFLEEEKHYVSIFMQASISNNQKVINMEPAKVSKWEWFDFDDLPKDLFLPLKNHLKAL